MNARVLIAGLGNIFCGDDAFGVETVRRLTEAGLPDGACAVDFGIRSYDLAFALTDGYAAVVLVDATPRGEPPGTVYLIEPDLERLDDPEPSEPALAGAHAMNPVTVLRMARSLGGIRSKVLLVGCEPARLETEDGEMALSAEVESAIPRAVEMIQSVVGNLMSEQNVPAARR